jgi:hypothetical protein
MTFPFCVILDANIWIGERLLQTSIGSALLYSVSTSKATIVVPEIVELEANKVLREHADKAVEGIRKHISLLKRLSGNSQIRLIGPTGDAVHHGMMARWERLTGVITRIGFTHDHARKALNRILSTCPPCGKNNEQFRDCCIWEAALEVARDAPVHLITGDSAFYGNRDNLSNELSPLLQTEARKSNLNVNLHRNIAAFLSTIGTTVAQFEENELIAQKITQAVLPAVNGIIDHELYKYKRGNLFAVGDASKPKIQGFSTPEPNICAVSFSMQFQLQSIGLLPELERNAVLTVDGTCSYDTQDKEDVAEVEIDSWTVQVEGSQDGWQSTHWQRPDSVERTYSKLRLID